MVKIKICGITRKIEIEYVNELLPDFMGFVFAKNSRHYVSPEDARVFQSFLNSKIKVVGVFVDEPMGSVIDIVKRNSIDIIQLHGSEDQRYISKLRNNLNLPIIKAFSVTCEEDAKKAAVSKSDYILLDNKKGGSGEIFDWSFINALQRPYFLAGGLESENVALAINALHPYAVDASSKLEKDGVKYYEKMRAFINAIRNSGG